jgi:ribosome-dependent ATPase
MSDDGSIARFGGVTLTYGRTTALADITMDIPSGCMAGVIGPDGVGKSSLLALASGVRVIQKGSVRVLEGDMARRDHRSRVCPHIAYMPQGLGRNLYMTLSVRENIDFFSRLFDLRGSERLRRIDELMAGTGLTPFADRPAGKLSGGMKQKLGLCCALIHDPDLLILDEPTTGVDPLSRQQFWKLVERVRARREGMSVLVATAYMEEAQRFDWLAAMDGGKVLATGSPGELLKRTGAETLDAAFIELLPEARRKGHTEVVVAPRGRDDGGPLAIEAKGLTKRFGSFTAVDHVDLDIKRGEIFGFLGSNGCGKTTTMKMLTGLVPPSEGIARLFGKAVDAGNIETRKRVGYMTQSFSLYGELSVRDNLMLHAKLFHLPRDTRAVRVAEVLDHFDLTAYADAVSGDLPLGIRQRLSLAVAVIHDPDMLILDEPTSGVDPVARDAFWELLIDLSRNRGVTIFISTHFMNEGERCDRISLMHAGRVLACDTPAAIVEQHGAATLEDAFIEVLREHAGDDGLSDAQMPPAAEPGEAGGDGARRAGAWFNPRRMLAYGGRELLEVVRDPVRLVFSLLGSVLLLLVLGYGITFDVDNLNFAVLDRDNSPESRDYIYNMAGSRYFVMREPIRDSVELDRRMADGELAVALEIPPDYGHDLRRGRDVTIGVWIDGAMPFRGETVRGYLEGLHALYLKDTVLRTTGVTVTSAAAGLAVRYRYNQGFESLYAMVPAVVPLLLVFIPSILTALGVVREKELGSITNLYATPVTRLEFLLGKQGAYVLISMVSYFGLMAVAVFWLGVPLKGSFVTMTLVSLVFVSATTGLGLLFSSFIRTQVAALAATAVITLLVTITFSGLTTPVAALQGPGAVLGKLFPMSYFMNISRGLFTKALHFDGILTDFLCMSAFVPVYTLVSALLLRKQEK